MELLITILSLAVACAAGVLVGVWLCGSSYGPLTRNDLHQMEQRIMSQLSEEIAGIKANILEGTKELTDKIAALEEALNQDTLSEESRTALDELKTAAKTLADIIPNPPPPET